MKAIATIVFAASLAAGLPAAVPGAVAAAKEQKQTLTAEQKAAEREARLKIASDGLDRLYKIEPGARDAVEKAVGYAVFDITSVYAILLVGQKGKGVLFDNATKKPVFMSSLRAGTGPGVGKQRVFQIFVFKTKDAMNQFQLAGNTGGDISGSISTGSGGSVRSFNPSIDIYQVPESGAALQASWGGTVYSVDSDLQ
jgi:lipid-binding SYLF domain-containing protein